MEGVLNYLAELLLMIESFLVGRFRKGESFVKEGGYFGSKLVTVRRESMFVDASSLERHDSMVHGMHL